MHRLHSKLSVRRLCNTGLALTLTAVMVLGMVPVQDVCAEGTKKTEAVLAEDEIRYERIDISTAEEFADFASNCYIDSWSENKYVSLKADIDLAGTQICVVPVFNGIFDGVGHTISGFDYTGDGYVVGLFRYVESEGLIQNLTLKGNVASGNERQCVGSVCGVNYGSIKNCTFQGTVSGRDTVGGIAGMNGVTGIITGCAAKGRITGYYSTGGIVGINHGTLNYCSNRAGINDDSAWVEEDDEMGSGMGILESLTDDEDSELYSGVDTGGIAGFSDGVITRCTNSGTVGYEHTGYNIGGIAGRQSGIVSLSTNNGTVYGRKDIGGIIGQMEPFIEINEAESIRAAVDRLHELVDKTINDMQAAKNGVKRDFDALTSFSEGAVDAADALAEQIGDFVDDNLDQMQSMTNRFDHVLEMAPGVLNHFEVAENSFNNATEALKNISDDMGKITDVGDGSYDVSKNKRITLLHTVGGYITSDSYNPKAGEPVKIMAETDEVDGSSDVYRLVRIDVVKVTNGEKAGTSTTAPYTFTMPAENVRVEAYFEPDAGVVVTDLDAPSISFDLIKDIIDTEGEEETDSETEIDEETEEETEDESESGTEIDEETREETDSGTEIDEETREETDNGTEIDEETEEETDSGTEIDEETEEETGSETEIDNGSKMGAENETAAEDGTGSISMGVSGESFLSGAVGDDEGAQDDGSDSEAEQGAGSPVVKITSNLSGNASYSYNDDDHTVTVTAEPSGGYTVDYVTLDGSRISPAGGNSYSFQVSGDREYNVSIQFRKIATTSGVVGNAKSEIENAIREVQDTINKINDNNAVNVSQLQKMLSATNTIMENTEILADIYGQQASDALKAVNRNLGEMSDHLKSALGSIRAATRNTRDIVDYLNEQSDITFTKLGAEYDYNRINLHNHLQAISDTMKLLSDDTSRYSDTVNADLRAVNDQINVIFNLLADRLSDAQKMELAAFYNDVGDEDIDSITTGRAEFCNNKGIVKGDSNVGGIVGSMSIDDEDLSDSAVGSIEYELGRRFLLKCLVTDSVNEGYVTSKKNGAGGICGYMDHGIIVDSESYGSVESTEGDYVGGICGEAHTIVERCYVLCSVAGNRNVGGIAGYADTLKNCYSMADVHSDNGRAGAIAGQVSGQIFEYSKTSAGKDDGSEDTAEPKVSGNFYVGEKIHGIDNISYIGIAEPISYQDLLTVEQLPAQFWHLKVIYKIEDTYLGSEEVKYGEKLNRLNFPQIPGKEGFYGEWPDVSDRIMYGTMVIEAEYKGNVTVVQSNAGVDSTEEGQWQRPYALVEDIFTEDTILAATISDMAPPAEAAERQYVMYEVTLENGGIKETDSFALRLLNPYEDAAVYGYKDGVWTQLESKSRGQYIQVDMTGTQQYFCIVENTSDQMLILICAAAAAVVVILLIVMIKKGMARRKQRRQKKAEEETEEK